MADRRSGVAWEGDKILTIPQYANKIFAHLIRSDLSVTPALTAAADLVLLLLAAPFLVAAAFEAGELFLLLD